MKNLILFTFIASTLIFSNCSSGDYETEVALTSIEIDDLKVLREEEKLARDVYLYAYDVYGMNIFINISKSEQKTHDKILTLLNTYNIEDPALTNRGKFTNQTLQTLYDQLTAQVDISLLDALKASATIEDLDINDIIDFENRTDKSDILNTYDKLKCGSINQYSVKFLCCSDTIIQ